MNKASEVIGQKEAAQYSGKKMQGQNIKGSSWSDKYSLLSPWFDQIMAVIKRDCKSEHLSIDPSFVRAHFSGKPVARISLEEMRSAYLQQIFAGQDRIAEFIANRWLFRNMDLYTFFESRLKAAVPEFEQIEQIPLDIARSLVSDAIDAFGVDRLFCFVVLNEVALPPDLFAELQKQAIQSASSRVASDALDGDDKKIALLQSELRLMKERHEKKLQELQRRHQIELQRRDRELQALQHQIQAQNASEKVFEKPSSKGAAKAGSAKSPFAK